MESLSLAGIPLSLFSAASSCLESDSVMSQSYSGMQTVLPEAQDENFPIQNKIIFRAIAVRIIYLKVYMRRRY